MTSAKKMTIADRLLASATRDPSTGCLRWTGAATPKGYGHIYFEGRTRAVHRVAHEVWIGPIPDGLDIDHVHEKGCRFRDCIEPSHLEAVTHAENTRRRGALITHCPKGHEYTAENTLIVRTRTRPGRWCYTCKLEAGRRWNSVIVTCSTCGKEVRQGNLRTHERTNHDQG